MTNIIFDDQNVESHKMTTDNVLILFKKSCFNKILACLSCLGVKCIGGVGVIEFLSSKYECNFINSDFLKTWDVFIPKKMIPLSMLLLLQCRSHVMNILYFLLLISIHLTF